MEIIADQEVQSRSEAADEGGIRNMTLAEQRLAFASQKRAAADGASDVAVVANAEVATEEVDAEAPGGVDSPELEPTAPAPEAGEENEPEEGDAASTAEDGNESHEELPKSVRDLQKRVNKLTAEKKSLEEKLAKQPKPVQPAVQDAKAWVLMHDDVRELDNQVATAEGVIAWVDDNPNGGEVKLKDGSVRELDEAEARLWKQTALVNLQKAVARREVLVDRLEHQARSLQRQAEESFAKAFAWARKPASDEAQAFAAWREQLPWLEAYPDGLLMLGYAVEGFVRAKAAGSKATNGNGVTPSKPRQLPSSVAVPSSGRRSQTRMDTGSKELAAAEAAFRNSGSMADLKRVEAIKQKIRATSVQTVP